MWDLKQLNKDVREQIDTNIINIQHIREDIVYKIDTQEKELWTKIGEMKKTISKHMAEIDDRCWKMVSTIRSKISNKQ